MSKAAITLGAIVVGLGTMAFVAQEKANAALRREILGLREDVRRAIAAGSRSVTNNGDSTTSPASSVGNTASSDAAVNGQELAKLRDEIVALRKSTTALTQLAQTAQAAQALAKTSESVPTKLVAANDLRNAGRATPEASTETALWAAVGGDIDSLANTLTFTASAKAKADTWFAGLSDSTKQKYGSPEKVIALMIARDAAGLTGMQVLGQKELTADDVGVRVRFASSEGKTKDDTFLMHRAGDGWRMVLPDNAVEKFARQLAGIK